MARTKRPKLAAVPDEPDPLPPPELLAQAIELVDIDTLVPSPNNPNEGDVGAIDESVQALGNRFYQVIFVQRSSGRIIAGEHRWRELQARGAPQAPVVFLDVDDATADRIMVGDNEIPRLRSRAKTDLLAALLTDMAQQTPEGLRGTGHDDDSMERLLREMGNRKLDASPQMPDGLEHRVVVKCRDEAHQREVYALVDGHGWDVQVLVS